LREAARFLETFSDILEEVVERGSDLGNHTLLLEAARKDVETVHLADPSAVFEIGEGDVFWRGRPLAGTVDWPWRERLLDAGVAELAPPDDADAFRQWVERIRVRLSGAPPSTAESARVVTPATATSSPTVAMSSPASPPADPARDPTGIVQPTTWQPPADAISLEEEAERAWWLHGEAANRAQVPRRESEELVERLVRALGRGPATATGRSLEVFDEFTTVHVINVSLLAMGLARHLAFDEDQVRALGVAGLLHDVGRVRLDERGHGTDPTAEARRSLLATHPQSGARVLMDSGNWFAAAAVVAYEHQLTRRGSGGYPALHFARPPHQFSRIISVCDTFDTLRTERPHRPALSVEGATEYLRILAGKTLDPEIVTGFGGFASDTVTCVVHPRTRPEASPQELRWLPDGGFDPDFEPRPVSV
jgi:hypothetical protein